MNKLFLLAGAALAISGCSAVPGLVLFTTTLTITSDHTADIPNDGTDAQVPVICDDRQTIVTYGFDYSGDLSSWTSELVGKNTGEVKARTRFTVADFAPVNGRVTVNYRVPPLSAPLSVPLTGNLSAQAIIVVPNAQVIGFTKVRLAVQNSAGDSTNSASSDFLPVVDNCPS